MVRLRLAIDVSGACLARGVNNAGERVEAYAENPTVGKPLTINVANDSNVDFWVKSAGYYTYRGSVPVARANIDHTENVVLTLWKILN